MANMKPTLRVLTGKEDGGDHDPSVRRATTTPEPLPQENYVPDRNAVKVARPTADSMTCRGVLAIAFRLDNDSVGDVDASVANSVPSVDNAAEVSVSLPTHFEPFSLPCIIKTYHRKMPIFALPCRTLCLARHECLASELVREGID
jgi:hypothetical protein